MDAFSSRKEMLPYECALDVNPRVLAVVNKCEQNADSLKEFLQSLRQISEDVSDLHTKLTTSYQDLSEHLKSFHKIKNVTLIDPKGNIEENFSRFSEIVGEMSSFEHISASQISDSVVNPLCKFVDSDLVEVDMLSELYKNASNDVDRAIGRYGRIRRKDGQQERHESTEEVYKCRKKYHEIALQFYARLNQLQTGGQLALLRPMLGLVTASRGYFKLGNQCLNSPANKQMYSEIGLHLKKLSDNLIEERDESNELIQSMLSQSQLAYYPMPSEDVAKLTQDIANKNGYLNVHRKYMGVMSSWERQFTFVQDAHLMTVPKGEACAVSLLELDSSTLAHATDTDDRMHVFTVSGAKKSVILQALNDHERDEWMSVIEKQAQERGAASTEASASSSLFSDVGHYFVDKLHAAVGGATTPTPTSTSPERCHPTNTLRGDVIPKDAPIVFDILGTDDEDELDSCSQDGRSEKVKTFSVRFLGSMNVQVDTVESFLVGQPVVFEVMRRILEARAVHNLFTTSHLHLSINSSLVVLRDPLTNSIKHQQKLRDISFWAAHSDNPRYYQYYS